MYIGRFAPSPTGPLHFGSLLAALASFCDARAAHGKWLVRIEDTDPPREVKGAAAGILQTLDHYGFEWDGEVLYQSQRHEHYEAAIHQLQQNGHVFWCSCSRNDINRLSPNGIYPGTCRHETTPRADSAVRLRVNNDTITFTDRIFGTQKETLSAELGDFVIKRRDGLFAYQIAVVVDDAAQGITDIVRGADLLNNTARQIYLQHCLNLPAIRYAHLPLIVNQDGGKLSKQGLATPLPADKPSEALWLALSLLKQNPPESLQKASPQALLDWAVNHWQLSQIPADYALPFDARVNAL